MSHPTGITAHAFKDPARQRLQDYLTRSGQSAGQIVALTPDASTREYFRVPWHETSAVVAVYPEPFDPDIHPYLDVTRLFAAARLPVPEVLDVDGGQGIIVQEDLGDRQLRRVFETAGEDEREAYVEQAISLIADIQGATALAYERDSIASRLAFDEAKLSWELDYFFQHYFKSMRGETLKHTEEAELRAELYDYHAANLIVDGYNRLRVIDHQDARMGPASYDLVSLLLDRVTEAPTLAEVRMRRLFFLAEREQRGLQPAYDADEFAREFRLMTVQRCLKAVGTFSCQTAVFGRGEAYAHYIEPMLLIVLQAAQWLSRFPVLQRSISARVLGK
jgi:N-acetylmuramate 1-kinase